MYHNNGSHTFDELTVTDFDYLLNSVRLDNARGRAVLEVMINNQHSRNLFFPLTEVSDSASALAKLKQTVVPDSTISEQDPAQIPLLTTETEEKIEDFMSFGNQLIKEFVAQNDALDTSTALSNLVKFQTVIALLQVGGLVAAKNTLLAIPVNGVFTQQTKDYFVGKIDAKVAEWT